LSVFGESNNNQIEGVFVFKGTDVPPEMIDVPDYESYTFTRLDFNKQADKDIFEDFLADEGKFEGIPRPLTNQRSLNNPSVLLSNELINDLISN